MATSDVFVIRIWLEATADHRAARRGYVEHVATGSRRYFSELSAAVEFVAALSHMPGPPAPFSDPPSESDGGKRDGRR